MADIFAEVDEAMRQERVEKFWKENGSLILTFVLLTILATAGFSGYRTWDAKVRATQTDALIGLLDDPAFPEKALEESALDLRPNLEGLALLNAAGTLVEQGKTDEALAAYSRASENGKIAPEFRDIATLMSVRLLSAQEDSDPDMLIEKLRKITNNAKSPWKYHAHLETALILAHKRGDYETARTHLAAITDAEGLPASLLSTARSLDHVYALRAQAETKAELETKDESKADNTQEEEISQ
ncbi:MAG: tetratricopeptide repeat protein [Alphaproteobacteria bacterium]|nr:tetratricopeptide repeat protein [Alphaproteobacteria bacterium]